MAKIAVRLEHFDFWMICWRSGLKAEWEPAFGGRVGLGWFDFAAGRSRGGSSGTGSGKPERVGIQGQEAGRRCRSVAELEAEFDGRDLRRRDVPEADRNRRRREGRKSRGKRWPSSWTGPAIAKMVDDNESGLGESRNRTRA